MKRVGIYLSILFLSTLLSACGGSSFREYMGLRTSGPDEFQVMANPPLSLPPSFELVEPRPGVKGKNYVNSKLQAQEVLFNETIIENRSPKTHGERSFLRQARVADANPEIKSVLQEEAKKKAKEGNLLQKLVLVDPEPKQQAIVDAARERERIANNKKQGKSILEGKTPIVEPKQETVLDKLGF